MTSFTERCADCGGAWDARPELLGRPATDFGACAYRCHRCGIAFSNATRPAARIMITRSPEQNVPPPARPGLMDALDGAVNLVNRPIKKKKFCSARSEDAVTWTVVSGLRAVGAIGAFVGEASLGKPAALLVWGHPVEGPESDALARQLSGMSAAIGEGPNGRTEPDVVALWPGRRLLVVEAKYGSANDRHPGYAGYRTYLPAPGLFRAVETVIVNERSYQLMRNWVIGAKLAVERSVPFSLVNLGPPAIAPEAARFADLLATDAGRTFEHRRWGQALSDAPIPAWLGAYAGQRKLLFA